MNSDTFPSDNFETVLGFGNLSGSPQKNQSRIQMNTDFFNQMEEL
jgi:hypothetical protein